MPMSKKLVNFALAFGLAIIDDKIIYDVGPIMIKGAVETVITLSGQVGEVAEGLGGGAAKAASTAQNAAAGISKTVA